MNVETAFKTSRRGDAQTGESPETSLVLSASDVKGLDHRGEDQDCLPAAKKRLLLKLEIRSGKV